LLEKKYLLFAFSILALIAASSWLRALVALEMNRHVFHPALLPGFDTLYLNSVTNITLWLLLIMSGKMVLDQIHTRQRLDLLDKQRMQNELDFLKAQINPHAVFNSLNTI